MTWLNCYILEMGPRGHNQCMQCSTGCSLLPTYTRLTRCQLLSVMLLLFQVFFFITNYMLICKLLLLPCDMHYCILFILCLQTVPGEGEVHVKEEASEFIVSSCTILLFFILQTKTLLQL